jgi:putative flippase GtrA
MKKLLRNPRVRKHAPQALKFIVCGLTGAAFEFCIIYLLVQHLHWDPRVAYIPSGLLTVVFVFFFNKYVTFGNRDKDHLQQTMRFAMVYGAAFVLNYLIASGAYSVGLLALRGYRTALPAVYDKGMSSLPYVAKAFAIGVTAVWNYCFSHAFVFKARQQVPIVV